MTERNVYDVIAWIFGAEHVQRTRGHVQADSFTVVLIGLAGDRTALLRLDRGTVCRRSPSLDWWIFLASRPDLPAFGPFSSREALSRALHHLLLTSLPLGWAQEVVGKPNAAGRFHEGA